MAKTECYCDYYCDDLEQCEFVNWTKRKSRKEHKCWECPTIIQPGEEYWIVAAKWEGSVSSYKYCVYCYSLNKHFNKECCVPIGGLREFVEECTDLNFRKLRSEKLPSEIFKED